jgi:hypothetical protein
MKKFIVLIGLIIILSGCTGVFEKDEAGSSPALETVGKLRDANVASVPVNPYAHWVEIGLGILTVVLGGSYVKKAKEKQIVDKKYAVHKGAVDEMLGEMESAEQAILYQEIGLARKAAGL